MEARRAIEAFNSGQLRATLKKLLNDGRTRNAVATVVLEQEFRQQQRQWLLWAIIIATIAIVLHALMTGTLKLQSPVVVVYSTTSTLEFKS